MKFFRNILIFFLIFALPGCASMGKLSKLLLGDATLSQSAVVVPFELINGAIIVPVKVNDSTETMHFLLDTGTVNAMSVKAAQKVGISELFRVPAPTVTGAIEDVAVGVIDRLEVGNGAVYLNAPVAIYDLDILDRRAGIKIDGLIGNNFLQAYETTIDFQYNRLVFQMPFQTNIEQIDPDENVFVMPFDLSLKEGIVPRISGKINDEVHAVFTLDTGNLGDTFLTFDTAVFLGYLDTHLDHLSGLEVAQLEGEQIGGYTGLYQQPIIGKLKSIRFGRMEIGPHIFIAAQAENNLLGYSVLRNYKITLNFEKRTLVFRKWKEPKLHKRLYNCGLAIGLENGKYVITGLVRGSAAQKAGLSSFDEVLELNGQKVEKLGMLKIQEILADENVKTIELLVKGKSRPISLEKKDILKVKSCILRGSDGND